MEGYREIARSCYERASEAEKSSIRELFGSFDVDGDGRISLAELERSEGASPQLEAIFRKLDANGDGCLDFDEFLCLHRMMKVVIRSCDCCRELLVGPYFSCLLCVGRGANSYDLCCSCYRRAADSGHEHSSDNMMDHHSLLMLFGDRAADDQISQHKRAMAELGEIAKSHYKAAPPQVQAAVCELFRSMDSDGDGRVDRSEFLALTKSLKFFDDIDVDGDGGLDFWEVMTLYYVLKSGRPFCNGCSKCIPGIFFSCVHCFMTETSFELCPGCYPAAGSGHNHDGRAQFLDNYTLLKGLRDSVLAQSQTSPAIQAQTSPDCRSRGLGSAIRKMEISEALIDSAEHIFDISTMFCTIM